MFATRSTPAALLGAALAVTLAAEAAIADATPHQYCESIAPQCEVLSYDFVVYDDDGTDSFLWVITYCKEGSIAAVARFAGDANGGPWNAIRDSQTMAGDAICPYLP